MQKIGEDIKKYEEYVGKDDRLEQKFKGISSLALMELANKPDEDALEELAVRFSDAFRVGVETALNGNEEDRFAAGQAAITAFNEIISDPEQKLNKFIIDEHNQRIDFNFNNEEDLKKAVFLTMKHLVPIMYARLQEYRKLHYQELIEKAKNKDDLAKFIVLQEVGPRLQAEKEAREKRKVPKFKLGNNLFSPESLEFELPNKVAGGIKAKVKKVVRGVQIVPSTRTSFGSNLFDISE